jgi:hypothetical protein
LAAWSGGRWAYSRCRRWRYALVLIGFVVCCMGTTLILFGHPSRNAPITATIASPFSMMAKMYHRNLSTRRGHWWEDYWHGKRQAQAIQR